MCGISGVYSFSNKIDDIKTVLLCMNDAIAHRGPDFKDIWIDENQNIGLGHTRLSIIGVNEAGNQPMQSTSSKSVIVYNGEVYNYQEFGNDSHVNDTAAIVDLYEQKGEACLHEMHGMFSFAVWDKDKEELFLANDRIGKKPLYYCEFDGKFAFASEIKALLELPWVKRELDQEVLYYYLTYNFIPAPYTMFKGIKKFFPGYKMKVNRNGIQSYEPYFKLKESARIGSEVAVEKLYDQIDESVKSRMLSDVPVGVFLSGGVDSSAVVGIMRKYSDQKINTYTIGFEGQPDYDELDDAAKVAKEFNCTHHKRVVSSEDIKDFLPKIAEIYDEPVSDPTSIPIFFLAEMARKNGDKVILTGDGPDELFLGYRSWRQYLKYYPRYNQLAKLPKGVKGILSSVAKKALGKKEQEMFYRLSKGQEFFQIGAKSFKEGEKDKLLHPEFLNKTKGFQTYSVIENQRVQFEKDFSNKHDYCNWMTYASTKLEHPNRYLYRTDRLGMANGVEIRSPFLDYRLVEMAMKVPGELKFRDNEPKWIFKKALENVLSDEVLYRKKKGFCVPIKEWIVPVVVSHLEEHFERFNKQYKIFNTTYINTQIEKAKSEEGADINELWVVYMLINWCDKWL